ncbi:MAG: hypothetical protein N2C14_30515, partial [Planctomycetales bacterium]
ARSAPVNRQVVHSQPATAVSQPIATTASYSGSGCCSTPRYARPIFRPTALRTASYSGAGCCSPCGYAQPVAQTVGYAQPAACPPAVGSACKNYWVGRGIVGQPKLYISGQPVRNALRFVSP